MFQNIFHVNVITKILDVFSEKSVVRTLSGESKSQESVKVTPSEELAMQMVNKPLEDTDILTVSRLGQAAIRGT